MFRNVLHKYNICRNQIWEKQELPLILEVQFKEHHLEKESTFKIPYMYKQKILHKMKELN